MLKLLECIFSNSIPLHTKSLFPEVSSKFQDFFQGAKSIPFHEGERINYTRLNCAIMQQLGLENTAL